MFIIDVWNNGVMCMDMDDKQFLMIAKSRELRPILLGRLQSLGLLDAFLQAENETTQEA